MKNLVKTIPSAYLSMYIFLRNGFLSFLTNGFLSFFTNWFLKFFCFICLVGLLVLKLYLHEKPVFLEKLL